LRVLKARSNLLLKLSNIILLTLDYKIKQFFPNKGQF
jgi:hypothetical protein